MMVARKSLLRRPGNRVRWLVALGMLTTLVGCAPGPQTVIPSELPLTKNEDIFEIRWALQKEAAVTRAVGLLNTQTVTPIQVTVGLFGLDAQGRIVSRGTSWVRPSSFNSRSLQFSVELTPTGQEARYELRILDYRLPGFRMD
jgi:hypothetical protein